MRVQDTRGQSDLGGGARVLGWLTVLLAGALLLLPGVFTIPPVDRDESRFAQATSQMLAAEDLIDWAVPKIQETPRLNKPPLIYWLQAGSVSLGRATGFNQYTESMGRLPTYGIGWYRLPSVLCAMIAGLLTYLFALRVLGGHVIGSVLAGVCLLACPMVLWDARQARADQLLLACTTLAMVGLHTVWCARNEPVAGWRGWFALWVGLGLGVMTKGPITPMVVALSALALSVTGDGWAWLKRTRPVLGVLVVAAMVGPWVGVVISEVGAGNYLQIVFEETIGRSGSAAEGHWGPPGYHLVLLALMLWPVSLVIIDAVVGAFSENDADGVVGGRISRVMARVRGLDPQARFLIAWVVPSWIVFEAVSTKLPHYVLPLYPALAVLGAQYAVRATKRPSCLGIVIWFSIGIAVVSLPYLGARYAGGGVGGGAPMWFVYCAFVVAMVLLGRSLVCACRARMTQALIAAVVSVLITSVVLFSVVFPGMETPWVTARVMREIERVDPDGERPLACVGYQEDSLVFSTGGRIERVGLKRAKRWFEEHPDGLMVIDNEKDHQAGYGRVNELARLHGLQYSNGKGVTVLLVERWDDE